MTYQGDDWLTPVLIDAALARMKGWNWTQVRLGREVGVHARYLSQVFHGRAKGSPALWSAIFSVLEISVVAKPTIGSRPPAPAWITEHHQRDVVDVPAP